MFSKYVLFSLAHFIAVVLSLKILSLVSPEFLNRYYNNIVYLATVLLASKFTFKYTKKKFLNEKVPSANRAVLITGCDTGFGHLLAKRLDSIGFRVFASCLFPTGDGAQELKKSCSKRLEVLGLDVGRDESVSSAFKYVNDNLGTSTLWAIVNNAGIQKGFNLDFTSIEDFQDCMNINSLGPVRVTKAFLPLLKKSKGRVVNVTSIIGRVFSPYILPYFVSKFAAVGFTGCLRQELALLGISVVSIEPEFFQTEFANKEKVLARIEAVFESAGSDIRKEYGEAYEKTLQNLANFTLKLPSPKVELVVDDLELAVTSVHPAITYRPQRNSFSRLIWFIFITAPENVQDIIVKFVLYMHGIPKAMKLK